MLFKRAYLKGNVLTVPQHDLNCSCFALILHWAESSLLFASLILSTRLARAIASRLSHWHKFSPHWSSNSIPVHRITRSSPRYPSSNRYGVVFGLLWVWVFQFGEDIKLDLSGKDLKTPFQLFIWVVRHWWHVVCWAQNQSISSFDPEFDLV